VNPGKKFADFTLTITCINVLPVYDIKLSLLNPCIWREVKWDRRKYKEDPKCRHFFAHLEEGKA
jgi:hypothetical protein